MTLWASAIRNEKGVALPLALIALVVLTGLLLVFLSMAGLEPQVSANLNDGARARYVAEAGIEWAFDQLVTSSDWDVQLRGPDNVVGTADDGQLASGMTLPGLADTWGTFTVTVRNDSLAGDTALTGLAALDGGGVTDDQNNAIIVTATGTYKGVSRQIQAVVTRLSLNIPGGLNFPGIGTNTRFSGNSFRISGHDTNPDGSGGTCPSVWGISVADTATEAAVEASLTDAQEDNVVGKKQNPAEAGKGDNTIAPDTTLTPAQVSKFVDAVKQMANISLQSTAAAPLSYTGLGDTCAANWDSPTCWGTPSRPKIVYVKGDLDTTNAFAALTLSGGSTGAGILIVQDGDLRVSGSLRWEGLVIVTGKYVGLRYSGGGDQAVYGAIVVNEEVDATDPNLEVDTTGNANVYYSCQALDNVRNMRGLYSLTSWKEL